MLEKDGKTIRPFLESAGISQKSCSILLQRKVVDFSADTSFNKVPEKLKEHYGFEISQEVIRNQTLKHAECCGKLFPEESSFSETKGVPTLIAESDGCMVPIVSFEKQEGISDKRKLRKTSWKEAKLCFARKPDTHTSFFSATTGSPDELGDKWLSAAVQMGFGYSTKVHCLGDGALWIKDQADRIFGSNSEYLIDFYHLSEYLFAAGEQIASDKPKEWLSEQQEHMKHGNLYLVLQELETHLYGYEGVGLEKVKSCYRYITNRLYQLDYLGALMQDLPIGSGEIESAHRHVIQKRIKKSGAWWKLENVEAMLQLLTLRANGFWEKYWESYQQEEILEAA